jgi:hypothetical protein
LNHPLTNTGKCRVPKEHKNLILYTGSTEDYMFAYMPNDL